MASIPDTTTRSAGRFSIYRSMPHDKSALTKDQKKRASEAMDILPFLVAMDKIANFSDVQYGPEPPDFIFQDSTEGRTIAVELTMVNPMLFPVGGNRKQADYKVWLEEVKEKPSGEYTYEWGEFTLRESLASLRFQFQDKIAKAQPWKDSYSERWLILHLTRGSPFGSLVPSRIEVKGPDATHHVEETQAKTLYEVCNILREANPFDCVFMFSGIAMVAFPKRSDPYRLPMPRWDIVARGAGVSDALLDVRSKISHHVNKVKMQWSADGTQAEI